MDIISLYYFKELTQDLNMTKTAARLFISQQTLSNHILRLETEFKTQLFYRKPKLMLTDSGRHMLMFAKTVLTERKNFEDKLADIETEGRGIIRFGASYLRSSSCLPHVLPTFTTQFPKVSIHLTDSTSAKLQQLLLDGELDLALSVLNDHLPSLSTTLILADQIYLCISDQLLQKYYGAQAEQLKEKSVAGARVADFKELPYFVLSTPNILGITIAKCFEEADYAPYIYFSTTSTGLAPQICTNGLAACFLSQMNLNNNPALLEQNVNIFPLLYEDKPVYHNLYLAHHAKQYLTKYMLYFMELLKEYFSSFNEINLTRMIK